MTTIHIHEFSTGILVDGTGGAGEWRSRGFSGEYMNSTLAEIPRPVQLAIKNREFAVSEGASSQNPAIIGREVEYHGEAWSVIAVVTRGMDERGRGASLYRYFLCQERGKLPDLVSWYMKNGMPTFNPSDHKQVDWFTEYDDTGTQINDYIPPELDGIWEGKTPIIITQKQPPYTALIIHKIASKTDPAKYNKLISWACNVEALEKPNRFLVIHPASKKAEETIRATINSIPQLPPAIPEEPLIRTAIKNSCRTGNFQENLAPIEDALNNPKIQQDYTTFWNSIFEGQGSKDAYEQQIYDDFKVRLLTLQAIICPEKLPDFVAWIMNKDKDSYPISQSFQGEIVNAINPQGDYPLAPTIFSKITQGIDRLILNVIEQPELIDATAKLLSDKKGLWGRIYKDDTSKKLKKSLKERKLDDAPWQEIKDDLSKVWDSLFYPSEKTQKYIHLAHLFDKLEEKVPSDQGNSLTVFFYHLAQEKIPSDVYKRHKLKGDEVYNFDIKVKRDIPWYEPVFREIKETAIFLLSSVFRGGASGCFIAIIYFLLVFTLGGFFFQRLLNLANLSVPGLPGGSNNSESPIIKKAIESFPTTKESLMQIKSDLMKTTRADNSKSNPQENEIDEAISKILDPTYSSNAGNSSTSNNYLNLKTIDKDKDKWIQAIIYYQLYKVTPSNSDDIDGIIDKDGTTYQALKCNLLQNMQLQATQATADNCKKLGFSKVKVAKTPAKETTPSPSPSPTRDQKIEKAVSEFDPNNEFGISLSRMTEPADKEAWVKAILQYQESLKSRLKKEPSIKIDVDGVINYGKNTYNLLKCDVAAQLGKTLSKETSEICDKVKPIDPS
ncbi:MAG: hypothetical protein EWV44_10540 [Microcystis flos-aquae Mf_QC_C_20070823_S20T]|nr:MAG: hypothetical protein EWV44_10540 [Microcystis flos-aquae Mf_QC_C_20070823_S20T]